jgi:hypothetical protein
MHSADANPITRVEDTSLPLSGACPLNVRTAHRRIKFRSCGSPCHLLSTRSEASAVSSVLSLIGLELLNLRRGASGPSCTAPSARLESSTQDRSERKFID